MSSRKEYLDVHKEARKTMSDTYPDNFEEAVCEAILQLEVE